MSIRFSKKIVLVRERWVFGNFQACSKELSPKCYESSSYFDEIRVLLVQSSLKMSGMFQYFLLYPIGDKQKVFCPKGDKLEVFCCTGGKELNCSSVHG
jgi:hypothetical protein